MLIFRLPGLALGAVLLLFAASPARAQIAINGPLSDSTTGPLLAGTVYHVVSSISVPLGSTLTAQPGAIVKFASVTGSFTIDGTLNVAGTAGSPVVFTAIADDTAGGDTNADGAATLPVAGAWRGLDFNASSDASTATWMEIRYGGQGGVQALNLDSADIALASCTVRDTLVDGLDLSGTSFPTVVGCSFLGNAGVAIQGIAMRALPGFSGNTASGNGGGDHLNVTVGTVDANLAIETDDLLAGTAVLSTNVTVATGVTLTIGPGTILKADAVTLAMNIDGALDLNGTSVSPVVFTTLADDSIGGDTANDGPTSGAAGSWRGLDFNDTSDASTLDWVEVRYGGQSGVPPVNLDSADIALAHCTIRDSGTVGLDLSSTSFPTVADCAFTGNVGLPIQSVPLMAVPGFTNNVSSANGGGERLNVTVGTVSTATTIAPENLLGDVLVLAVSPSVNAGSSLTLQAGTIVKADGVTIRYQVDGALLVNGSAGNPVILTSIADDSAGGDTANDGPTSGAVGNWRGLAFSGMSDASSLASCEVRFGGQAGLAGIDLTAADITLTGCTISDCSGPGLDLSANSLPTVSGCTFTNTLTAVDLADIDAVPGFTNNTASGPGANYIRITSGTLTANRTITATNCLGGALVTTVDLLVPAGRRLTLDPGVVVKASGVAIQHVVDGRLITDGTGGRVVFTSIHDDAAGGDTNNNGNATLAGPSQWRGLLFGATSDASTLFRTDVRYGGQAGLAAVTLTAADIALRSCEVVASGAVGILLQTSAHPSVRECTIRDCAGIAVDGVDAEAVPGFAFNTATGNGLPGIGGNYLRITSGLVDQDTVIEDHACLGGALVTAVDLVVADGATLTLGAGVVLKAPSVTNRHVVDGVLVCNGTALRPVVFTAMTDDSIAGDTNGDLGATVPAPGTWRGLLFTAPGSQVRGTELRYGGQASLAVLECGDQVTLDGVRIERGLAIAFDLSTAARAERLCAFACGTGFRLSGGGFDLERATAVACGTGIERLAGFGGTVVDSIAWNNSLDYSGFVAGGLRYSNGNLVLVGQDGNIFADPLFVDEPNGDLHLTGASPSIDAGDPVSPEDPDCTPADQGAYAFDVGGPSTYCTAKTNTQGCDPFVDFTGRASATSPDPFVLTGNDVLNNKAGLFFYGTNGPFVAPFNGGTLCAFPPLRRTDLTFSGGTPPPDDCTGTYAFDFNARIQSGADPFLIPGATVNGQFWSRDPAATFGVGLTNAVQVPICP